MKFSVYQEQLKFALAQVSGSVPSRTTLPILTNVLLTATEEHRLKVMATDLDVAVTTWRPAKVDMVGSVTVPFKILNELVNNLPNDRIYCTVDQNEIMLECGRFNSHIKTIPADEYPAVPDIEGETIRLDAQTVQTGFKQCLTAVATDDSRPVLTAVNIEANGSQLSFAGADGFRLARRVFETSASFSSKLIPAKTGQIIAKSLAGFQGEVFVTLGANLVRFMIGGEAPTEITSRLIDGKYPDVARVIPTEAFMKAKVNVNELQRALKLALLSSAQVRLYITEREITINTNSQALSGQSSVTCEGVGEPTSIAVNGNYLWDALTSTGDSHVMLEVTEHQRPMTVRPTSNAPLEYIHIVMPMIIK